MQKQQMPFRLPPELMRRVERAAEYCGQTRQAFVQTAVLAEVAEVEERRRMKKIRSSSHIFRDAPQQQEESTPAPTSSLIEALRQRQRDSEPSPIQPTSAQQQGQVVVNVGGSAGTVGGDTIDRLAAYVSSGSDIERDTRLRTAVSILSETTATEEERKVLSARLDEAIATKTRTANGDETSATRLVRATFDKLTEFWKG